MNETKVYNNIRSSGFILYGPMTNCVSDCPNNSFAQTIAFPRFGGREKGSKILTYTWIFVSDIYNSTFLPP